MTPGTVLFDHQFQYNDGTTGKKLVVVLNDGESGFPYLVIKTTSKQKRKRHDYGCNLYDLPPNFYLPENSCGFKGETWLLLEEFHDWTLNDLFKKKIAQTIEIKDTLPAEIFAQLIECALLAQDLSGRQRKCLEEFHARSSAA